MALCGPRFAASECVVVRPHPMRLRRAGAMPAPEGITVRKGIFFAGVALLVVGLVAFVIALVGVSQATADLLSCMNGVPFNPSPFVPSACSNALAAVSLYDGLELLGGVVGVVGFVLLIVGLVLPPERPALAPMPYYPPPVYGAPPGHSPPQTPQPPPQP